MKARKAAAAELESRQRARDGVIGFAVYTMPHYVVAAHHRAFAAALEAIERRELNRVMIYCPPRHGKSEIVSRRWPARYMGRFPDRQFISISYNAELASSFGRDVRNIIAAPEFQRLYPGVGLAADSKARGMWHTTHGGVYVSAGVGGGITGRGAHVLSIDDPFKDRMEADSPTVRESVWNWYTSTAYTRLMPSGAVVVTNTRWHEDDLAGRLLNAQAAGGDRWHVVNLPAIALDGDMLGRAPGEALWPERYPLDVLRQTEAAIGPRDWGALYQQDPRPLDGGIFDTSRVRIIRLSDLPEQDRAAVSDITWQRLAGIPTPPAAPLMREGKPVVVRGWDFAATEATGTADPDYTVGVKMMRLASGMYVIADVQRFRGGPETVERGVTETAGEDGKGVSVDLPQDPGSAGKSWVAHLTKKLAGYRVTSAPVTGDKATRAAAFASQVNVGNVVLVEGPWNSPFLEELRSFPSGRHDDQVDAGASAFNALTDTPAASRRANVHVFGR